MIFACPFDEGQLQKMPDMDYYVCVRCYTRFSGMAVHTAKPGIFKPYTGKNPNLQDGVSSEVPEITKETQKEINTLYKSVNSNNVLPPLPFSIKDLYDYKKSIDVTDHYYVVSSSDSELKGQTPQKIPVSPKIAETIIDDFYNKYPKIEETIIDFYNKYYINSIVSKKAVFKLWDLVDDKSEPEPEPELEEYWIRYCKHKRIYQMCREAEGQLKVVGGITEETVIFFPREWGKWLEAIGFARNEVKPEQVPVYCNCDNMRIKL